MKSTFISFKNQTPKFILLSVLILMLLLGLFLRFYRIKEIGLSKSNDHIFYTNIAKSWSEGNFIFKFGHQGPKVFRPVVYISYALGIKLLGYHSYSIKMVNAFFGSLNIFLIFLVCLLMTKRNLWLSLSSALIYAFLPMAIYFSRVEMPHTISTTMVLLSFLLFVLFFQSERAGKKYLFLILSGIFVGLAALTHEDLILVAFGFLAFLFGNAIFQTRKKIAMRTFIKDTGIFSFLPLIVSCFIIASRGDDIYTLQKARSARQTTAGIVGYIDWFFRYMWNAISANFSKITLWLFLLVILLVFIKTTQKFFKIKRFNFTIPPLFFLPVVIVIVYIVLYAYFLPIFWMRLFSPLAPLVFIAILTWAWKILDGFSVKFVNGILVLIAIFVIPFHLEQFKDLAKSHERDYPYKQGFKFYPDTNFSKGWRVFVAMNYKKSWASLRYEELKDRVNENAKILIAPSNIILGPGRRVFQLGYYFGDNAIYIVDHDEPLDELISKYKIKYVLFSTYLIARYRAPMEKPVERYKYNGQWDKPRPLIRGSSYGFKKGEYSVTKEFIYLKEYFESRNAKILFRSGIFYKKASDIIEHLNKIRASVHYIVWSVSLR